MSFKSGLGRLALTILDKSWSGRSISSVASKCAVKTTTVAPIQSMISLSYLKAPNHRPDLIDPGLVRIPKSILDVPLAGISQIIDVPSLPVITTIPPVSPVAIEDPTKVIEQQAARLIVIRRAKMRKHKLKKLRIKMKFAWAKQRQKRELKKEKLFQAELMGKIREAERFDAAAYASAKIEKSNQVLIPKLWKGKRLPEFLIKQLLEERHQKHMAYLDRRARREKMLKNVADYKV
uniref:Geranylgeranylglyceryl phosphate synthase n=1 Tax=Lygus hesperus TaxID=30085 RepID=A0A0A9Z2A9_LYGHE